MSTEDTKPCTDEDRLMTYSNNLMTNSENGNVDIVRQTINNISTLQPNDISSILGRTFVYHTPNRILSRRNEESGWTALKYAISKGHTKIVEMILDLMDQKLSGEAIESILSIREPALTVAISNGHTEIVEMILDLMNQKLPGDAIESILSIREPALTVAISNGHTAKMILDLMNQKLSGDAIERILIKSALTEAISEEIVKMIMDLIRKRLLCRSIIRVCNAMMTTDPVIRRILNRNIHQCVSAASLIIALLI